MIIGIKDTDKVYLAFSSGDFYSVVNAKDLIGRENVGLWKVKNNENTIMGCKSLSAETDAFRYEEEIFQGEMNFTRLTEEIIPKMEEFIADKEYLTNSNKKYSEFLIAQKGKLFYITCEHIVRDIDEFIVLGKGPEDYVKGVLYSTKDLPPIDRIRKAFEMVSVFGQDECFPISVMDTVTGEIEILTRESNGKGGIS